MHLSQQKCATQATATFCERIYWQVPGYTGLTQLTASNDTPECKLLHTPSANVFEQHTLGTHIAFDVNSFIAVYS